MKLKTIKISGFKSFVDSTTIQLQSDLTGIVGPNGCGKSNIVDAVRWVMGEISAKQLRGESMADVIFNGSLNRKSVGQASVELIFDNSDAGFGGEYAKYSEISIRRVVTRDGFSDYFLNNSSCRRKDITNIFMGSGLGANSYAVIEQGMISKIIEAKPDELRVMIEEAAGISRYKERRKETETRIRHTKENLLRLNDIRDELEKQLKSLKSQAAAADRYKKLKQEERVTKGHLCTLHYLELSKNIKTQEILIKDEESKLEGKVAESLVLDSKISQLRQQRSSDTENFNQIQETYYRIGANIGRLEQQIQYTEKHREQLTHDLNQANEAYEEAIKTQETDKDKIDLLLLEKATSESDIAQHKAAYESINQEVQNSSGQIQICQQELNSFDTNAARVSKDLEVEKTHIQYLEQKIYQDKQHINRFRSEFDTLDPTVSKTEVDILNNEFEILKNNYEALQNSLSSSQEEIAGQRELNNELAKKLDKTRSNLQELIGKRSSMELLQQAALGKDDKLIISWLSQHNLDKSLRLAQELIVESGWEMAVETILGNNLEAICVDDINKIISDINTSDVNNLILFCGTQPKTSDNNTDSINKIGLLLNKVTSKLNLTSLLDGIYAADSINQALTYLPKIGLQESIITKDGIWLGNGWVRVITTDRQKIGVLQRERELQDLHSLIANEENIKSQQENDLILQKDRLINLEREYNELQNKLHLITKEHSEMQSKISTKQSLIEHICERKNYLEQEIEDYEQNIQSNEEQLTEKRKAQGVLDQQNIVNESDHKILLQKLEQLKNRHALIVAEANKKQQTFNELGVKLQLSQNQINYINQNLERIANNLLNLQEKKAEIEKSLSENESPLAGFAQDLQSELTLRLDTETKLTQAKQRMTTTEHELHVLEQNHSQLISDNEKLRISLEKMRTEEQVMRVRSDTHLGQISELELSPDDLIAEVSDNSSFNENELAEKLKTLSTRIERLGLINLAAVEEFDKLQERKNYLDSQHQDLVNALNTLEKAIGKIDCDTKEQFEKAYLEINKRFQDLFPKIFNGGGACLEKTSEDLLETGLVIMAHPPGKRNSSIYLLSGGEKALTAIALIFSIFQLTPAPFCMLDEVDAPLDDINVFRFCNLVKEMAKTVQFIFITHNKLTMEIAEQLIGVTMREAGVSRIVSVDINTAIALSKDGV